MTNEEIQMVVREQGPYIFDRMFTAVEKVRERLDRSCAALENAQVPYAVIGGNAVAAWVATKDDGSVRNTQDVDLLLQEEDLDRAAEAMFNAGFVRATVFDVIMFLDGPHGKPSQGVHVLLAGQKVKPEYASPTPKISQSVLIEGKRIVELEELVRMKLNSYRRKDQMHLLDMLSVDLIDDSWPTRFESPLDMRLQALIDDPNG